LRQLGVKPDFEDASGQLDYAHRRDGSTDIYFVRNGSAQAVDTSAAFRVTGRTPELWNAVDGSMEPQALYREEDGVTRMPLHLAPYGSVFVVFARPTGLHAVQIMRDGREVESAGVRASGSNAWLLTHAAPGAYKLRLSDGSVAEVNVLEPKATVLPADQWTILFQPDRGAPAEPRQLQRFASWTESPDAGIRYFSGTATYRTVIDVKHEQNERVFLELAELHEICTVRINGKPAGAIWARPYALDVTDSLKDGENVLELDVTNLWPNRLIGDAQPSNPHAFTHTNIRKYTSGSALLPSGLIGPVTIKAIAE
jgi:hypothetical protein